MSTQKLINMLYIDEEASTITDEMVISDLKEKLNTALTKKNKIDYYSYQLAVKISKLKILVKLFEGSEVSITKSNIPLTNIKHYPLP